jgi:hypothetical protein
MQSDALDELRSRVDQRYGHVCVEPQVVGRDDACVPTADDNDLGLASHENSFRFRLASEPV